MKNFEQTFEKAKKWFADMKFYIEDDTLKTVLAAVANGIPVLATGPTGSGKTEFFELLAKFFDGEYNYQSLNGSVTIHDLTQERIIAKDGSFVERDMVLAKWLRKAEQKLSILQLDEINAAKPETLLSLHPIIDIKRQLDLPYSQETLKVDKKKAILVMSCNVGDEYSGINAMNMAFQNRYIKVFFPYLQGEKLAKMLSEKTGVEVEQTRKVAACWEKYMLSKDIDKPVVGTRILLYWLEMSKLLGMKLAGKYTFGSLVAEDEEELNEIVEGDLFVAFGDAPLKLKVTLG